MSRTKKENIKEIFFIALINSIKYKDHLKYIDNTKAYYDDSYLAIMREELKDIDSKELGGADNPQKKVKICSLASSGRLCFLDFRDKKKDIEKAMKTGVGSSTAKFDVVDGNIYYECKCQEIVNGERKRLKKSYMYSPLFTDFKIDLSEERNVRNGELEFTLQDLGIDDCRMYYELHFNVKQLLCHLMAIAYGNKGKKATLQYIIYTPACAEIKKSQALTELYANLKEEIDEIWNCQKIKDFCDRNNHNISLPKPRFREINTIKDTVYEQAYKS